MEIKSKEKEKKDRWWILDVVEFIVEGLELLFVLPRVVFRFLRDL